MRLEQVELMNEKKTLSHPIFVKSIGVARNFDWDGEGQSKKNFVTLFW